MSTATALTKKRTVTPPAVIKAKNGKDRLTGGRWNMQRVAEQLQNLKTWQTMDEISRFVYGSSTQTYRETTRKHIPAQRRYMLDRETPFITEYGPRGRIVRVKMFDPKNEDDRVSFRLEIERAFSRKEIGEHRYNQLRDQFLLTSR